MNCHIDEQLQAMGIAPQFDPHGLLEFTLQREDDGEITITLQRDLDDMKLRLSAQCSGVLTDRVNRTSFLDFARQALEPLRDGYGVGLFPDSERLSVFKVLDLRDTLDLYSILESVLSKVEWLEAWSDSQLAERETTSTARDFKDPNRIV